MIYILQLIRTIFCKHQYGNFQLNPFIDTETGRTAFKACNKCGKRKTIYLNKY